jgi:RNA polymerase sigma-70 factor (ECF subfamily)
MWSVMNRTDTEHAESASTLLSEARQSPAGFVRLYRRYYDDVFRYCVHRLFERHTAEDVTSEVFLKVVEHWSRFDGRDEQQFRGWLYRIAGNAINSHLRKMGSRQRLLQRLDRPSEFTDATAEEPEAERLALLKTVMLALKPRHQTIITLRFFENFKLTEIAEVLGCSPGTARSRLMRAVAQVRKKLRATGAFSRNGGDRNG